MKNKKVLLCICILENFAKPFSYATFRKLGPFTYLIFLVISLWAFLVGAIRDVISLIIIPDYPPDPEDTEVNGVVTYLKKPG